MLRVDRYAVLLQYTNVLNKRVFDINKPCVINVYSVVDPCHLSSSQTRCIMADDLDIEAMLEAPFRKVGVCILFLYLPLCVRLCAFLLHTNL